MNDEDDDSDDEGDEDYEYVFSTDCGATVSMCDIGDGCSADAIKGLGGPARLKCATIKLVAIPSKTMIYITARRRRMMTQTIKNIRV